MDENKTYSIVGKVEIGTDEYRDLITGLANAQAEVSTFRSKFWNEQTRAEKAEKELKEVKAKLSELQDFVRSDDAVSTKLKLYRIEKTKEE